MRDTDPTEKVRQNVRALRMERGWSAQRTANELAMLGFPEMTRTLLASMESGRRSYISVKELAAFATVFDITPTALLGKPTCVTCHDTPPRGFTCQTCGAGAILRPPTPEKGSDDE